CYSRPQVGPMYTLRDHTTAATTTTTTAAANTSTPTVFKSSQKSDPLAPSQDMFSALEKLLMGISPFPPSIPQLAKPTCPPLEDQTMAELSSPSISSSSLSSSSSSSSSPVSLPSSEPSEALSEQQQSRALGQHYEKHDQKQQHHCCKQHGSECSLRSVSPVTYSPRSSGAINNKSCSPSPTMAMESSQDLPYWSPSTPTLQVEREWSNHSSPLFSTISQPQASTQPSSSWNHPLLDQMSMPMSMTNLGDYASSSNNSNSNSNSHSNNSNNNFDTHVPSSTSMLYPSPTNIIRRAARTPPHNRRYRFSSELSGFGAYQSNTHYAYTHHHGYNHYYRNMSGSSFSSGNNNTFSNSMTSNGSSNGNNGNHHHHHNNNNSGGGGGSNNSSGNNNSNNSNNNNSNNNNNNNSGSNSSNNSNNPDRNNPNNTNTNSIMDPNVIVPTMTREGVKSYTCPTCSKSFPTRTQLKSHMAIHIDSFPFPCLYAGCDLHFKRKHDLRRHVDAKHALIKKYLCSGGCGEGFGRRDQMIRHLRKGNCGRMFMQTE
ncbi:hypothetical protein BX616_006006, partial [Lobosporangium transversale]